MTPESAPCICLASSLSRNGRAIRVPEERCARLLFVVRTQVAQNAKQLRDPGRYNYRKPDALIGRAAAKSRATIGVNDHDYRSGSKRTAAHSRTSIAPGIGSRRTLGFTVPRGLNPRKPSPPPLREHDRAQCMALLIFLLVTVLRGCQKASRDSPFFRPSPWRGPH